MALVPYSRTYSNSTRGDGIDKLNQGFINKIHEINQTVCASQDTPEPRGENCLAHVENLFIAFGSIVNLSNLSQSLKVGR